MDYTKLLTFFVLFTAFAFPLVSLPSPSSSTSELLLLNDESIQHFITSLINACNRIEEKDSCETLLRELTVLVSSLPKTRRLNLLNVYLNRLVNVVIRSGSVRTDLLESKLRDDLTSMAKVVRAISSAVVPTEDSAVVPTYDSAVALTYDSDVVPTDDSAVAHLTYDSDVVPTDDSAVALTYDSDVVPTDDSAVALTYDSAVVPTDDSAVAPTYDSTVVPTADFPSWVTGLDSSETLKLHADFTVSKDGTGFKTITDAVAAIPENRKRRFIIYVKKGLYKESLNISQTLTNLTIVGDGRDLTIITGSLNNKDGVKTFASATLGIDGNGFIAQDLCIQNTAGPAKGQAVALRVSAYLVIIYRCRIEAYQDTLYAHSGRQFYRDSYITGTVDFICGHASAVFQYCQIEARKPLGGQGNVVTAQNRDGRSLTSGFVFQKCNITAASDLAPVKRTVKTFLGRPWGSLSRVVFMESFIDDNIDPAGYTPMNTSDIGVQSTLYYGEYQNHGQGADTTKRVPWKGFKRIIDPKEAANFTVGVFIEGESWLKLTGVPYELGL